MNRVKTIVFQYPVLTSILLILVALPLTEIHFEGLFSRFLDFQDASYLVQIIEQGSISVALVILINQLGLFDVAGFTGPRRWRALWLIWPIFIYFFLNGGSAIFENTFIIDTGQPVRIVLFGLANLSTGLFEETLFRGSVLTLLLRKWGSTRKGVVLAVLVSSSIFGILHLINLVMGRRTLLATLPQMAYGICFGVFFAACVLRNHSIWPAIISHAVFNIFGNLQDIVSGSTSFGIVTDATPETALISGLIALPLLLYGLFLLRKAELLSRLLPISA